MAEVCTAGLCGLSGAGGWRFRDRAPSLGVMLVIFGKWFMERFAESLGLQVWSDEFNGEGLESVRFAGSFSTRYGQRKVAAKEEKLTPDLGGEQVPVWERLVSYWVKRGEG